MRPVSTAEVLRHLRLGLLVATVAALAGTLLAIDTGRRDAEAMRTAAAPAREGLAAARYSLMQAHAEALNGLPVTDTTAVDPGEEYRTAVAAAGRQLAQVSESDIGDTVKQGVQVVESLFATYLGLMEQARAHARDDGGSLLAQAYARYAHDLLNQEMLPQLQSLSADVDTVTPDDGTGWLIGWWALPVLGLLALLTVAQVFLARRFRRVITVPLLVATVLTLGLGVVARTSSGVGDAVADSRGGLARLVDDYGANERVLAAGCASLPPASSGSPRPACPSAPTSAAADDRELLVRARDVAETSRQAADTGVEAMIIATVLALLTALLILLGLQPRIEEYRFRSR